MQMTPAQYVIFVFKGVRATARAIGRSPTSISKWQQTKEKRGTNGEIPRCAQKKILEVAHQRGLDITAADVIYGRAVVAHE